MMKNTQNILRAVAVMAVGLAFNVSAQEAGADAAPADGATPAAAAPADAAPPADGTTPAAEGAAPAAGAEAAPADGAPAEGVAPADGNLANAEREYELRVRDLEGRINDLKENIHRSKAKLTLLTEAVTAGGLGRGAQVIIVHRNDMGSNFLLTDVNYFLDGGPLWQEVDESGKELTEKRKYVVWEGNIVEGSHTLAVGLFYKGNGSGVFSYLAGYTWALKDSITFTAEPGKRVVIEVVGYEDGNFTTELTDRPAIRFDRTIEDQVSQDGQ